MGSARVPMTVPRKTSWRVTANDGDPRFAADDRYATTWTSAPSKSPWIEIDLGAQASLGGLEVYWGQQTPTVYRFEGSADRKVWSGLCRTRHGEGAQDVFAFPPVAVRFIRLVCEPFKLAQSIEVRLSRGESPTAPSSPSISPTTAKTSARSVASRPATATLTASGGARPRRAISA
jgi:hypothetical protein